jgi:UDP-glucose:(heptosyl)LPS alpha-1,3-glucosyltransferase
MNEIIFLKKSLSGRGGLENQTFQITQAFQKKGYKVTCLTSGTIDPYFQNLHCVCFPVKSRMNFLKVLEFDRNCQDYLKRHPAQIVFGMERNRFQTHLRLGNGIHRAYLDHIRKFEGIGKRLSHLFNPAHQTFLKLEKRALEHPDLKVIIANSFMVQKEILHYYDVDPSKIHVLHNGVDWHGRQNDFEQWEVHKQEKFQFLFVGHNYRRKGLDLLLKGLSKLKDYELSVVGHDRHLKVYQNLAESLGIEKNVRFFGAQTNLIPFYQKADCLVIPSLYDPFSNATTEALAMGVYVLSSKTNGGHEVLQDFSGHTIDDLHSMTGSLQKAMMHKKSMERAKKIRDSIKHLDFSHQLKTLIEVCV